MNSLRYAMAYRFGGRLHSSVDLVREEIERLTKAWASLQANETQDGLADLLGRERMEEVDLFDRVQLASVIDVCRNSRSLSDAGRRLFSVSRDRKATVNDADRLRKYLNRFGIDWSQIASDS
jgi:transcriptional regulatory protein RtcR